MFPIMVATFPDVPRMDELSIRLLCTLSQPVGFHLAVYDEPITLAENQLDRAPFRIGPPVEDVGARVVKFSSSENFGIVLAVALHAEGLDKADADGPAHDLLG
jgi:hypothetical protein